MLLITIPIKYHLQVNMLNINCINTVHFQNLNFWKNGHFTTLEDQCILTASLIHTHSLVKQVNKIVRYHWSDILESNELSLYFPLEIYNPKNTNYGQLSSL